MVTVTNINDVLDVHVTLVVDCCDRLLLNAYVPALQTSGQVASFMRNHLGKPIPSRAVMDQIGSRFRRDVKSYASRHKIPVLHVKKPDRTRWDDRKLDHVRPYLERAQRAGRYGVVAIVRAQEFQWVFSAKDRSTAPGRPYFEFVREQRRVGVYYFYVLDPTFGPSFVKMVTYFPYPAKVWANGHEWAKRQAEREGITFRSLQNGFAACWDPGRLQASCDRFGPDDLQGFFDRWIDKIPRPLTDADREAGYFWELSMRQVEVSRTVVFDDPRRARRFFESLVQDNIDIGRPESVSMVFSRRVTKRTKEPFRQRVFTAGSDVRLDFSYKHSRVKQYLKEARAYRIETVVNKPADLGVLGYRVASGPQYRDLIEAFDRQVQIFERDVRREVAGHPGYHAIQAIPGVGPLFAAIFVAEIGDATRFSSAAQLCSWAGLTPRHRESDTTVKRGPITKQGSRLVRWAAIEAAQRQAAGTKLRADFTRITAGHGDTPGARKVARVAVARKIVTLAYYGLRDGTIRSKAIEQAA